MEVKGEFEVKNTRTVAVWCPAENKPLGTFEIFKGKTIKAVDIVRGLGIRHPATIQDGVQIMCPTCFQPLVLKAAENEMPAIGGHFAVE